MPANSHLLQAALIGYQSQISKIEQAIAEIRAELKGSTPKGPAVVTAAATPSRTRSKFSAASRKKMAAAQKKRWALYRQQKAAKA